MRRKKHKQTRRATNYYRINYGFHEPYKVLLDGNFIHATKAINLSDLDSQLPKLLGGTCKLYTTKCVTQELRSLGPQFSGAAAAARSYLLHKCDHGSCGVAGKTQQKKKKQKTEEEEAEADERDDEEDSQGEDDEDDEEEGRQQQQKKKKKKGKEGEAAGGGGGETGGKTSAADCIRAVIGRSNEQHWFVATQDVALRRELGKIPGCPLVFATVNGIHLETPSEVTKQKAKEAEAATRSLAKHERAAEPLLREEQLAELRREAAQQQQKRQKALLAAGSGGSGGAVPAPTTSARFRRNKAKGPNPLAVKRKIKKAPAKKPTAQLPPQPNAQQQQQKRQAAEEGQSAALAAAKRRRKRPMGKAAAAAAAGGDK